MTADVIGLVHSIAVGDTAAFATFYESWFDRALHLARSLTRRDDHFCFDVVQDAMLRAVRSLSPRLGITSHADLDRWMTRVVHTTALDALRKESRRRARERLTPTSRSAAVPSDTLAERIDWLRAQIEALDSADRSLLASRFGTYAYPARTLADTARDHSLSPGSATGRLTRLLTRLRRAAKAHSRNDEHRSM